MVALELGEAVQERVPDVGRHLVRLDDGAEGEVDDALRRRLDDLSEVARKSLRLLDRHSADLLDLHGRGPRDVEHLVAVDEDEAGSVEHLVEGRRSGNQLPQGGSLEVKRMYRKSKIKFNNFGFSTEKSAFSDSDSAMTQILANKNEPFELGKCNWDGHRAEVRMRRRKPGAFLAPSILIR